MFALSVTEVGQKGAEGRSRLAGSQPEAGPVRAEGNGLIN
jgi:hypothetical protein